MIEKFYHPGWKQTAIVTFMVSFILAMLLFLPKAQAQIITQPASNADPFGVEQVEEGIILSGADFQEIVFKVIRAVLGLLGLIALVLILYAGYLIMTSGGNEDKIEKGKKTLINATIGIAIILSALAIVQFLINALSGSDGDGGAGGGKGPQFNTFSGSGALGSIIKDHYPEDGQTLVPRNTKIAVTFFDPIVPSSIIENYNNSCWNEDQPTVDPAICDPDGNKTLDTADHPPYYGDCIDTNFSFSWEEDCDHLKTDSVQIFVSNDSPTEADYLPAAALTTYDAQKQAVTFVFQPFDKLGSESELIWYTVRLMNGKDDKTGIFRLNADNEAEALDFGIFNWYDWQFQTDTKDDEAPPIVVEKFPEPGSTEPRNAIIQVTFNEAMDPLSVQGVVNQLNPVSTTLSYIVFGTNPTSANPKKLPAGEWVISNGYRTIEFIPTEACGINSCGQAIFCIQLDCGVGDTSCTKGYETLLRTGDLIDPDEPNNPKDSSSFEIHPFTGIADMAGNGLDGNSDQIPNNKPSMESATVLNPLEKNPDNHWWNFNIKNTIDLTSPYLIKVLPGIDAQGVLPDQLVSLLFSKKMLSSSLYNIDLEQYASDPDVDVDIGGQTVKKGALQLDHTVNQKSVEGKTEAQVKHDKFGINALDFYYFASASSSVKDIYQNCLYPGRGPEANLSGTSSICTFDPESSTVPNIGTNCLPVDMTNADKDTGCSLPTNILSIDLTKKNIKECVDYMKSLMINK